MVIHGQVLCTDADDNIMTDTVSINHNWSLDNCLLTHPELNLITKSNVLNLYAYVDADHGRDIDTRRLCILPWRFPYMLEVQTAAVCRYL